MKRIFAAAALAMAAACASAANYEYDIGGVHVATNQPFGFLDAGVNFDLTKNSLDDYSLTFSIKDGYDVTNLYTAIDVRLEQLTPVPSNWIVQSLASSELSGEINGQTYQQHNGVNVDLPSDQLKTFTLNATKALSGLAYSPTPGCVELSCMGPVEIYGARLTVKVYTYTVTPPIPEPTAAGMAVAGAIMPVVYLRRRKTKQA